ncbi:hypothetical protein BaRGS_00034000 [Batillaria attramentaria]|uniref:Uncharacterized protein n=1 Tax=Batillaria attramentaria TaxID=370345 RepID=A0ABD0JJ45_9CAEN
MTNGITKSTEAIGSASLWSKPECPRAQPVHVRTVYVDRRHRPCKLISEFNLLIVGGYIYPMQGGAPRAPNAHSSPSSLVLARKSKHRQATEPYCSNEKQNRNPADRSFL